MTELLISGLQDSKIVARCNATEKIAEVIGGKNGINNLTGDQKLRLIRGVLANTKDSNHKVVISALAALELLLQRNPENMVPHLNICFDYALVKLGDIKVTIRNQAFGVLFQVLLQFGPAVGVEKLFPHFTHKNVIVREKLSKLIIEILHHCEANQMVEVFVPQLVANLSLLIQDSIPTVRQGAVDAVLGLHKYALYLTMHSRVTNSVVTDVANGTKLLVKLESTGVRPQVLRLIGEGIDANIANQEQFQPATLDVNGRVTNDSVVTSGKENITRESTVKENNKLSATTTGAGELKRTLSSETHEETDLEAVRAGTLRASGTTTKAHVSNNVHSISEHQLLSTKSPLASLVSLKPPTCGADVSCFHPSSYFPILKLDGTVAKPMRLYSEKDLTAVFEKISSGIMNLDDWQARMAALSLIQGVVSGDGCEYMALLVQYLKSIHEHISSAISDLRSVLSKEGCKTVATIANCLRDSFAPLVELLVPTLLKQVGAASSVVMTSAANKAMMVVLASASPDSGFTRAIPMLIEGCSSKSPSNRQHSIDFLAVCGSLWTTDAFDRLLTAIRHVLENGVVDKSPEVRRSARRLFWVLFDRRSSIWRESMQQMLRSVDSSTRKAILIECFPHLGSGGGASTSGSAQLAGLGSNEIRDLLLRVCPNNASTDLLQSDAPPASQSEGIVKAASATRTVRAKPVKAPYAATISSFDTREAEITSAADISEPVPSVAAAVHTHNKTDVKPMKPSATSLAPAPAPAPEATPIALAKTGPVRLGGGARRLNAPSSKNIVPSGAPTMVARPLSQTMEVVPSSNYSDIDTAGPDGTVTGTRRMSVADFMKTVDRNVSASMESRDSDSGVDSTVSSDVTSTEPKRGSASAVGRIVGVSSSTAKPAIESSASTSGGLAGGARRMFVPPTTAVREAPSSVSELSHASCVSMHPTTKNEQIPAVAVNKAMTRSMQQTSDQWDSNTNTIPSAPTRVAGDIMSIDDARKLLGDSSKHWESRVAAVESLQLRLTQLVNGECSYAPELWDVLDGVTVGLTDVHHRVTSEALNSIALFIDNFHTLCPDASLGSASGANSAANFNYLCVMKFISSCLPELFQRLLDQRPHIRGIANTLLNSVRITIDPVMVVTAIVPKISEVPDKVKTAVTQFLLVIVPHCGQYFAVPVHSATFLGRMALVLGSSTSKPSVTLMQSGTRLMEMVYKVCPQFICLQLALLPLQQQLVLKKVLQSSIPDIDALVTAAGKDFNRNRDSFSAQDRPSTLSSTSGPKVSLLSWQDIASSGSVRNRKPIARSGSATSVSSASSVLSSGSRCKPAVPSRSSKPNIGIRTANSAVSAPGEKKKENLLPTRAPAPPPVHAPVQPLYEDDAECYPTDDPSGAESIDRRDLYERSSEYSVASQPRPVGDMGSTVDSQKSQESEDDHHADFSSLGSAHEIYDTRASDSTLTSTQELQPSPIQSLGSDQRSGGMFSEANYVRTPTDLLPSGFRQSLSHSMSQSSVTSAVQLTAVDPTAYECSSISMDKVTDGPARSPVTSTSTVSAMSQQEVLVSPSGANKGQFVIIPDMRTAAGTPSHTTPKFDAAPHQGHSSSKPSTFHTPGRSHGHGQSQTRDISWLLIALQISSESNTKLEGLKELKQLAKQHGREQNEFWKNNCGQILSVLLDAFNPELYRNYFTLVADAQCSVIASTTPSAKSMGAGSPVMVTGFSPCSNDSGGANDARRLLSPGGNSQLHKQTESMHISCKALSILTKYRASFLEGFLELIVSRLCVAVTYAPVTIGFQCEQLLCEVALLNPPRFLRIIVPFASMNPPQSTPLPSPDRSNGNKEPHIQDSGVQMRLLGLHVLASAIKHMSSPQLLQELDSILASVLPSFSSPLVDMRKAVVNVLCEIFAVIGDALYPYIADELTVQQKKLLALYIQRFNSSAGSGGNNHAKAKS